QRQVPGRIVLIGEEQIRGSGGPPPGAQKIESEVRERNVAILSAFALMNVDEHAIGIDVAHAEPAGLTQTQAGGIENGHQNAVTQVVDGSQKCQHLLDRKHYGKMTLGTAVGNALNQIGPLEDFAVEEAQRAGSLIEPTPGGFLHVAQV